MQPDVLNLGERIIALRKVVVREVIRHVKRRPVKRNPIDYWLVGGMGFVLGILVGLIF